MKFNGGLIGASNQVVYTSAKGLYSLREVHDARVRAAWPLPLGAGTTWNPSDKGTNITLSDNDRTMTSSSNWYGVRSVASASSGKKYYEVSFPNNISSGNGYAMVGVGNGSANLSSYLGSDANSGGWQCVKTSPLYYPGGGFYGSEVTPGTHVAGILLDLDAGTLSFRRNNVDQGQAASGLSGTYYAMTSVYNGQSATANFYEGHLVYGLPSGYTTWS